LLERLLEFAQAPTGPQLAGSRNQNVQAMVVFRDTTNQTKRKYTRPMASRLNKNPRAASVMKRALILNAVFITGMTTPAVGSARKDFLDWILRKRSLAWGPSGQSSSLLVTDLKTAGLWPEVEEDEQELLLSDQVSARQRINASWLAESITCLLWSLRMISDLPHYDWEADASLFSQLRSDSMTELIKHAKIRPKKEIERQRQIAELWHWRARTRFLLESGDSDGQPAGGPTIEQIIERVATRGSRSGRLPEPIARDFPARGMPYCDLSPGEFATLTSIAQERHKAFNWLSGCSPTGRWADTRTDT
jgi:hypothetical protein